MKIYRSREGKFLGVCQGISDATSYSARYLRFFSVLLAFITSGWALAVYVITALLLPVQRSEDSESKGFSEKFEYLRDDTEDFVKREYAGLKEAGAKASKASKSRSKDKE